MNTGFEVKKIELSKKQPAMRLDDWQMAELVHSRRLQIELLEISNVMNPSDLVVVITTFGHTKEVRPIYIYQHRAQFLFQDGRYLLNTKYLPEFRITKEAGSHLDIQIIAPENELSYRLRMYYSTEG